MLKRSLVALLCCAFSFLSHTAVAQGSLSGDGLRQMRAMEDSLMSVADSMFTAFFPDERPVYCEKFVKQLVRTLKTENSYSYPFDKLKKKINIIGPDDNAFRIFNWMVIPSESNLRYYGAIQMPSEKAGAGFAFEAGRSTPRLRAGPRLPFASRT